ncbi:nudC domain-containing protein 1 isoform X1 [Histomonas meleagridis]|uniref:nudC domain-containing protein 1 isoform X1 n=1 Tax=Histomonas meleagridis TaxID=135588 RepID=UPI003559B1C8|nr:nudC domain-containing protein 1 isoform X1 [Histomonas meleagridis]KAH0799779.1 nudC domain-containing protein 1 isoform X1 [Histomonas meleagridis]
MESGETSGTIPPQLYSLYDYEMKQDDENIVIEIKIPANVNSSEIKISIDDGIISVHYQEHPPLIEGKLSNEIESIESVTNQDQILKVNLKKKNTDFWHTLVQCRNPLNNNIDAKSSFTLYVLYDSFGTTFIDKDTALVYLNYSSALGYVPALRTLSGIMFEEGHPDDGISLLKVAGEKYRDPLSLYDIGLIYVHDSKTRAQGYGYLTRSSELGYRPAHTVLGQLYSPLSKFEFQNKSPFEALRHFDMAISGKNDDPIALHEMAKLIYNGVGTDKSEKYAKWLQSIAEKIDPSIEPLEEKENVPENEEKNSKALIIGITVAALTLFGVAVFKFSNRRKK